MKLNIGKVVSPVVSPSCWAVDISCVKRQQLQLQLPFREACRYSAGKQIMVGDGKVILGVICAVGIDHPFRMIIDELFEDSVFGIP